MLCPWAGAGYIASLMRGEYVGLFHHDFTGCAVAIYHYVHAFAGSIGSDALKIVVGYNLHVVSVYDSGDT